MFMHRAERDREVREVATDAGAVDEAAVGGPERIGIRVIEDDMAIDEITDRLDAAPSRRCLPERRPGEVAQTIGVAIAAAQQKNQNFVRQILDVMLDGVARDHVG